MFHIIQTIRKDCSISCHVENYIFQSRCIKKGLNCPIDINESPNLTWLMTRSYCSIWLAFNILIIILILKNFKTVFDWHKILPILNKKYKFSWLKPNLVCKIHKTGILSVSRSNQIISFKNQPYQIRYFYVNLLIHSHLDWTDDSCFLYEAPRGCVEEKL